MKAFAECDVLFLNTWELPEQLQSQAYAVQLAQESRGGFKCFCSRTHQVRYFSRCILDAVMDKDGSLNRVFLSSRVLSFPCLTSNQQPLVQNMCDQCTKVIQVQATRVSICLTFINIGHL